MTKIQLPILSKPHAHLQTMIREPAKFQTDLYKTVIVVELCRQGTHRLSLNANRKRGKHRKENPDRKHEKIRVHLFFTYIKFQDPSSNHS